MGGLSWETDKGKPFLTLNQKFRKYPNRAHPGLYLHAQGDLSSTHPAVIIGENPGY